MPMEQNDPTRISVASSEILRWKKDAPLEKTIDCLVREEPLEIRVQGRSVAVTMRTPGHDFELAAGFLYSEGLIKQAKDIVEVAYCARGESAGLDNVLNVFLRPGVEIDWDRLTRHTFASSSCGLCGKASIEGVHQHFPPLTRGLQVDANLLNQLPAQLRQTQKLFSQTGGLHGAALFDVKDGLVVTREDVGRHNAVDKIIGWGYFQKILPFNRHILLVSGRASFEIMQKALSAEIPIVAAVSAPSHLAVDFARESGQTLVGFLREGSMNIYAGEERILP